MKFIEDICQKIVSPPKIRYSLYDLGNVFTTNGKRHDFTVVNSKGLRIQASFYDNHKPSNSGICVVYLHSMNGSRLESTSYVDQILKMGLTFCNFDFTGCGNSEGNIISFGANEKNDVGAVVDALKEKFGIQKLVLWGRSMGSACAIKYCEMMHNYKWNDYRREILGIVLDSCFKSFSKLAVQIGHKHSEFPEFLIRAGYYIIKGTLEEKGAFKVEELQLQQVVEKLDVPVLFLTSPDDVTVNSEHSQTLFTLYNHQMKKLAYIKGEHNQSRDDNYIKQVKFFIEELVAQDSNRRAYGSLDVLKNNKFESISDNRRTFLLEGDEWHRESGDCNCSLFPPPLKTYNHAQNFNQMMTRRKQSEPVFDRDRQKVKLNKYSRPGYFKSTQNLAPIVFK